MARKIFFIRLLSDIGGFSIIKLETVDYHYEEALDKCCAIKLAISYIHNYFLSSSREKNVNANENI